MIKLSDIVVTVTQEEGVYKPNWIVDAKLEVHEVCTVHREESKLIEFAKSRVRQGLLHRLCGDLRDDIEEMYALARMRIPYGPEMLRFEEIKKRIDATMRGGG